MRDKIIVQFSGEELQLDAAKALYWPAQHMLIVSDLHLGKGSFLRRHGSPLPAHDTHDTLLRLQKMIAHYQPEHLVCLGDSFHDLQAYQTMEWRDQQQLNSLIQNIPNWHWVLGNHDPIIERTLLGIFHDTWQVGSILLSHEPQATEACQIIGHFHPKSLMRAGGRRVSGPCFKVGARMLIMPAFGSYTGGLDCNDTAISNLITGQAQSYFTYNGKLWKLS